MLVGVGGSGKQSLAKLATFICQYDVFQISVTSSYGMTEFKADSSLYIKAGVKGNPVTFLMTDGQIINERFLVYINDLLSSGYIPDLMTAEEKEEMCNAVRNECKGQGIQDTPENLWDFFLDTVRKYLHVCLCFSVGDKFRIRAKTSRRSSTAPSSTGSSPGRTRRSFPSPDVSSRRFPTSSPSSSRICSSTAHSRTWL